MNKFICNICNKELEENEFYVTNKKYRHKSCKKCYNKKRNEYQREYRRKNKELVNKNKRDYYKKRMSIKEIKENVNNKQRERYSRYVIKRLLKNAESRALKNNLDFNITEADIIIPNICPLLEIPLKQGNRNNYDCSPSLDRIDNSKGYIKGNVWVISTLANTMKNKASLQQLILFSKNVLKTEDIVRTTEKNGYTTPFIEISPEEKINTAGDLLFNNL